MVDHVGGYVTNNTVLFAHEQVLRSLYVDDKPKIDTGTGYSIGGSSNRDLLIDPKTKSVKRAR